MIRTRHTVRTLTTRPRLARLAARPGTRALLWRLHLVRRPRLNWATNGSALFMLGAHRDMTTFGTTTTGIRIAQPPHVPPYDSTA
jgi:hypothetical protein